MEIHGIFPTPVYKTKLNTDISPQVVEYIKNTTWRSNFSNSTSSNSRILELAEFSDIKDDLTLAFQEYLDNIILPKYAVEVGITQSWLNSTENGQSHHEHNHTNSYLSAVVYLEAYEEDTITFSNREYKQIDIKSREYNPYNAPTYWIKVNKGDIVIFPSKLLHFVEVRPEFPGTRISLAANMVPRGKIGDSDRLSELFL